MDIRKLVLYAALTFVIFSLWNAWQADYHPPGNLPAQAVAVKDSTGHLLPDLNPSETPTTNSNNQQITSAPAAPIDPVDSLITVATDVLRIKIDSRHGDIVKAALVKYPQSAADKQDPFILLDNNPSSLYVANSSLIQANGQQTQSVQLNLKAENTEYFLSPDEKQLQVVLKGENEQGLAVKKIFTFNRGSYLVDVQY